MVKANVIEFKINLAGTKIDALTPVYVLNLPAVYVDQRYEQGWRSRTLFRRLLLFFLSFFFFFLRAHGREVELSFLVLDDVDHRPVQNHSNHLKFFSKQGKELHVHLKVLRANEGFLCERWIVGQRKLFQTNTDTAP